MINFIKLWHFSTKKSKILAKIRKAKQVKTQSNIISIGSLQLVSNVRGVHTRFYHKIYLPQCRWMIPR